MLAEQPDLLDVDKIIQTLGNDEKIEFLKNKLSLYIKSKKNSQVTENSSRTDTNISKEEPTQATTNVFLSTQDSKKEELKKELIPVMAIKEDTQIESTQDERDIYDNGASLKQNEKKMDDFSDIDTTIDKLRFDPNVLKLLEQKIIAKKKIKEENRIKVNLSKNFELKANETENKNIEMFYFTSESPTRRTLMINKTQKFLKGLCKHLNSAQLPNSSTPNPDVLIQNYKSNSNNNSLNGNYFYKENFFKEDLVAPSTINNTNANASTHQYIPQNLFSTLFKSKKSSSLNLDGQIYEARFPRIVTQPEQPVKVLCSAMNLMGISSCNKTQIDKAKKNKMFLSEKNVCSKKRKSSKGVWKPRSSRQLLQEISVVAKRNEFSLN